MIEFMKSLGGLKLNPIQNLQLDSFFGPINTDKGGIHGVLGRLWKRGGSNLIGGKFQEKIYLKAQLEEKVTA